MTSQQLVSFAIEALPGLLDKVQFDVGELNKISQASALRQEAIEGLLRRRCRVSDAWRYVVEVRQGTAKLKPAVVGRRRRLRLSTYPDVSARHRNRTLPVIALLLESPHKDEYRHHRQRKRLIPNGPAQGMGTGDAGGAILEYGPSILEQLVALKGLADDDYALLVVNPVPYLTSLHWLDVLTGHASQPQGRLNYDVRNHVWNQLWALQWMQADFLARLASYTPSAVLNCCTSALRQAVTCALCRGGYGPVSAFATHPAVTWQTGKPGGRGQPVKVQHLPCESCRF